MLTIYGSSDDLIEIEGDVKEEFGHYWAGNQEGPDYHLYLAVSDGTLLRIRYDEDGVWRFTLVSAGASTISKDEGTPDSGTDRVHLNGVPIKWVLLGTEVGKP